uniref:Uncharacterized protein n=1 Tax=Anopheles epiroticus TaxID=199890 RepID=A0A182PDY6_9DIPT
MDKTVKLKSGSASSLSLLELSNSNEDVIQQRINSIRMELDDTYNIFVSAQETLSSISFEHLSERLGTNDDCSSPSVEAIGTSPSESSPLVHDANDRVDVAKSLEQLNAVPKQAQRTKSAEDIPELSAFFKVIQDLTEGIKKISSHQQSITELNQDINTFGERTSSGAQKSSDSHSSLTSLSNRMATMNIN